MPTVQLFVFLSLSQEKQWQAKVAQLQSQVDDRGLASQPPLTVSNSLTLLRI